MLTERQLQVLEFIREQQQVRGITPSTAEIQEHFGFASPNAVSAHLQALEKKGELKRSGKISRGIVLTGAAGRPRMVDIPIFGTIPAGLPVEAIQETEGSLSIDVKTLGLSKDAKPFALKVRGDSMIGADIRPDDIVVFVWKEPKNGDIVAALIDGETTLKRYVVRCGRPYLKAENPDYPDLIPARELVIQGVATNLTRTFKR
jgi:repressor LexA